MDEASLADGSDLPAVPPAIAPGTGASTSRALARAGLIVTLAFLLSRILGYVRYVVIAAAVPVGPRLDAFFAAFRIPDFLFQLVAAGALASALIPVVAGLLATQEEVRAWRVVSTVTTLMLAALLVLAAVVLLLAPVLVPPITPGFDQAGWDETTRLTRIMLISPLFLALGAVATSVLNAEGRFGVAATAPLVYNLAIIAGAVFLVPVFGVDGLAYGVVLGAVGHAVVQLPAVRRTGARIHPLVDLRDAQARRALVLMAPRAIGLGATQIVFLVMTSLASGLEAGSISVFNFAFALLQIPIGVIGVPLGTVLLPSLSRAAALGGVDAFRRILVRGLGLLAWVMIAITALGIVVSDDVVRILFRSAAIGEHDLERTSLTLSVLLVGLTAHSLIAVLARAFYAHQDTATPVGAALVAVVVNIVAGVALSGSFGLAGLGIAIALGAWIETVILIVLLERRVAGLRLAEAWVVLAKSLVASALGAAAAYAVERVLVDAWGVEPGMVRLLVRSGLAVGLGGIVILVGSLGLRIREPVTIVGAVGDLIRRRGRA
jgi:putative peptidoglycan lipid II flippase